MVFDCGKSLVVSNHYSLASLGHPQSYDLSYVRLVQFLPGAETHFLACGVVYLSNALANHNVIKRLLIQSCDSSSNAQ